MTDRSQITDAFRGIVAEILDIDPQKITCATQLMADLGADSLDMVEIAMASEDAFGIELDDEAWSRDVTVAQAVDAIMGAAE